MSPPAPGQPLSFGRAHLAASGALKAARRASVGLASLEVVGDLRRFEPEIRSMTLLATAPAATHGEVLQAFQALPFVVRARVLGGPALHVTLERGEFVLHLASLEHGGTAMVWHTGSAGHLELLRAKARDRELKLEEGRLSTGAGVAVECPSEQEFYRRLDLPFIPPELRNGDDEVERAKRNALPNLVADRHIRGDLHMHTDWSDGRDTLEQMILAADDLRYEYVAITDHSQGSPASRTLSLDGIARQREDIDRLRRRLPSIEILHGVEVDILPDGTLDFPDEVLSGFDIVLASLHVREGQDGRQLTERYLNAIRHPLVNVITHPANRTPGVSAGFDLDFDALFAAATQAGTAMEIDGAPAHLDMDGALARRAVAAGVTVVIDSDCHRADGLERQMRFGVGTARRGWIEPASVLNTRGVEAVRAFVARKRAHG